MKTPLNTLINTSNSVGMIVFVSGILIGSFTLILTGACCIAYAQYK